ncbi:hypothetical protein LOZ05_000374 [Ophidiomyces ophidiicola]|nr:hypothetical protein LOZ05_000374 [Ophidiomyces ophidiicola]
MVDLTVGHVSGIIAAGINILQLFIPTATTLILTGLLSEDNSLATWTQIGRALHASHWPSLLRADSARANSVSRVVRLEGLLRPLILLVVSIAAVITPLGLYDSVVPATSSVPQPFEYHKDPSQFGLGTPSRSNLGFNRECGSFLPVACPGSKTVIQSSSNGTSISVSLQNSYDIAIPSNLTEIFESGLKDLPPTMSSLFDIQWRSYGININENKNKGSPYLVGSYKQMDNLLLKDGYLLVEGLVVDNKNNGIGFRHHTVPSPLKYGGVWSEDLLFIQPSTKCIDTNITVDFTIPDISTNSTMQNVKLVDHGGFSKLNTTYPQYDHEDPQKNPDLYRRAYKAAYLHNALTMLILNVTNPKTDTMKAWSYLDSTEGKEFPIEIFFNNLQPNRLGAHQDWLLWDGVAASPTFNISSSSKVKYPNPFKITKSNFTTINTLCQGAGKDDFANITNIGVACGLIVGAARRVDGSASLIAEPRSRWTVPLYSCASSARAVIKTVDFRYNGTDGLRGLSIDGVKDKVYKQDSDKPFWGVERPGIKLGDISAMWGLVSNRYKSSNDLSIVQNDALWLPGFVSLSKTPVASYMNLPGVSFYMNAFASIYTMGSDTPDTLMDYTGKSNLAMYARWQELSKQANTTSTIINQIWTDIAANAVLGTRGWISANAEDLKILKRNNDKPREGQTVNVPVKIYDHRVSYHIVYGIPAFIALLLTTAVAASSGVLCIIGRARPAVVRRYLFHTAPGRILGTFVYPNEVDPQAPTNGWNDTVGSKKVSMAGPVPYPSDPVMMAPYSNTSRTNMDSPLLQNKEGTPITTTHEAR